MDPAGEVCPEKRVFYKLISGLHSSISLHIASDYLLDEETDLWGQNFELLYERVLQYPDRVRNLYFTFLFVLRAVTKASDYLEQAEYNTGNPEEDLKTQSLVRQLVYNPELRAACPVPFDEAKLWQGESDPELKHLIQKQFKNIRWQNHMNQQLQLQRNEVIALMNLLNRLSESVHFVHEMGTSTENIMERRASLLEQRLHCSIPSMCTKCSPVSVCFNQGVGGPLAEVSGGGKLR
ncbi:hypothetical protein HPP92_027315 [Vanilla planifolia]|uniref:Uncharacterized protein n=1 Tax=Vanilla planifolia TaxID=51239 RepID=A0A835U812_VANPL|nr:hypothetical protein HPP92_027315 [Vanilla planifolia]